MKNDVYVVDEGAFQGELGVVRAELMGFKDLPADAKEVKPEDGKLIVGHSESGHHHFVDAAQARFYETSNPNVCFLKVENLDGPYAELLHGKPASDPLKHQTYGLKPGLWYISRQVERTLRGWEQVRD